MESVLKVILNHPQIEEYYQYPRINAMFATRKACGFRRRLIFCPQELSLAATSMPDIINIVLDGKGKQPESQIKRLLAASKHMVRKVTRPHKEKYAVSVNRFNLPRKASMGEVNF